MTYKRTLVYLKSEMDCKNIRIWIAAKPLLAFIISFLALAFAVQFAMQLNSHPIPQVTLAMTLLLGFSFANYFSFVNVARWEFNRKKSSMTRLQRRLIKVDLRAARWLAIFIVAITTLSTLGALIAPLLF